MGADRQSVGRGGATPSDVGVIVTCVDGVVNTPLRSVLSRLRAAALARSSTPIRIITCRLIRCSLKLECEKLATEKVEIQRHYVMVGTVAVGRCD